MALRRLARWGLIAAMFVSLAACTGQQSGSNIAVLDIDRAAAETGYTQRITEQLEQTEAKIKVDLARVQAQLNEQIRAQRQQLSDSGDDAQRQQLAQAFSQAQQQAQQARRQAAGAMEKKRAELVAAFHDQVRPLARRVAAARGLDMVVLLNRSFVLDYDAKNDITDAVIAELRQQPETSPAASPPKAQP